MKPDQHPNGTDTAVKTTCQQAPLSDLLHPAHGMRRTPPEFETVFESVVIDSEWTPAQPKKPWTHCWALTSKAVPNAVLAADGFSIHIYHLTRKGKEQLFVAEIGTCPATPISGLPLIDGTFCTTPQEAVVEALRRFRRCATKSESAPARQGRA